MAVVDPRIAFEVVIPHLEQEMQRAQMQDDAPRFNELSAFLAAFRTWAGVSLPAPSPTETK